MTLDLSQTRWDGASIQLMRRQELSRTSGGVTLKKDVGPALWRAELVTYPLPFSEADWHYAQLSAFENDSVLVRSSDLQHQPGYQGELGGVTVSAVSVDGRLSLAGLPSGVVLLAGARLSVPTGLGHEYFQSLDASDLGVGFRVVPPPRAVQAGMTVHLTPPLLELTIEPGTVAIQREGVTRKRVSFSGIQVIR